MRKFIEQWLGLRLLCHRIEYLENRIFDQHREIERLRKNLEAVNMELRVVQLETRK